MTTIRYRNHAYYLDISNLHNKQDVDIISKFDTGSVVSFFTLRALYEDVTDEAAKAIESKIVAMPNVLTATLHAASGAEMLAVKCHADDIFIGNIHFARFFYWMAPTVETSKALLGDDIVANCNFAHGFKGDIVINAFDMSGYEELHRQETEGGSLSSVSLDEIIGK